MFGVHKCEVVDDWWDKLPTMCEGYSHTEIFNMDETGLFYWDSARQIIK